MQSWHAIQYHLCEVGVPADREDPRAIRPAVSFRGAALNRKSDAAALPWEPHKGLFASPVLSENEFQPALEGHIALLDCLAKLLNDTDSLSIAHETSTGLGIGSTNVLSVGTRPVALAENVEIGSREIVLDLSPLAPVPVLASVTNDAEWLYPDDPRLWQHLERCREQRAYAVFIARKISIATFPLLKQMSALGVQTHQMLTNDQTLEEATDLGRELTWVSLAAVSKIQNHPAFDVIRRTLSGITRSFALHLASEHVSVGTGLGLHDFTRSSPALLKEWATISRVEMPDKWFGTLHDWIAWDERTVLRKPYQGPEWPA